MRRIKKQGSPWQSKETIPEKALKLNLLGKYLKSY